MTWPATVASVAVGIVFIAAGASKLASGAGWRTNARDLGAPDWIAPVIPWVELGVGALLVVQLTMPWPAIAALIMLAGFTALIALRMRAGERPACACFGRWSASEIGPSHLVRNGILMALAVVAAFA